MEGQRQDENQSLTVPERSALQGDDWTVSGPKEQSTCRSVTTRGALTFVGLVLCWELSRPGARFVVDQSKAGNWTCWLSHCITSTFGILGLHFCVSFYTKLAPWLAWTACWAGAATSHPGGAEPSSPPLTLHRVDILHVGLAQVRAT